MVGNPDVIAARFGVKAPTNGSRDEDTFRQNVLLRLI